MISRGIPLVCLLGVALLAASAAGADQTKAKPQATGTFASKTGEFDVAGAYAFPGKVGDDGAEGILVAVSNSGFQSAVIDHYWDREHFINADFADDETAVVWFHFDKGGKYRGYSYYFGAGDGCGLCFDSSVTSTVKVAAGRIAGRVRHQDPKGARFDVTFDVPVAPAGHGQALPADGGAPGRAYHAYHEAVSKGDAAALKPLLPADRNVHLTKQAAAFISYLQESHPDSYRITRGFLDGDHALLLIAGEKSPLGKVHTEAHLIRQGSDWVVDDEVLQNGEE
jgi:hypothetical protein